MFFLSQLPEDRGRIRMRQAISASPTKGMGGIWSKKIWMDKDAFMLAKNRRNEFSHGLTCVSDLAVILMLAQRLLGHLLSGFLGWCSLNYTGSERRTN